jgi:hypothetical protein
VLLSLKRNQRVRFGTCTSLIREFCRRSRVVVGSPTAAAAWAALVSAPSLRRKRLSFISNDRAEVLRQEEESVSSPSSSDPLAGFTPPAMGMILGPVKGGDRVWAPASASATPC